MKSIIIISIAVVLLIPLGVSNLIQQSYASSDIVGIELELIEFQKIESRQKFEVNQKGVGLN